jgi:hypothetical protein
MEDGGWKIEDGKMEYGRWRGRKTALATGRSAKIICALDHAIEHRTHLLPHLI